MGNPNLTPDRLFERAWATLLLERVFAGLRTEYEDRGAAAVFDVLKPHLAWNSADRPLKEAAEKLQMKEGAVRVAVLRLRKRFQRLLEGCGVNIMFYNLYKFLYVRHWGHGH